VTDAVRVVVVTGASSGIGRAVALQAAAEGDVVVVTARGEEPLRQVAQECRRAGASEVMVHPLDVGDDGSVGRILAEIVDDLGRIDAVVHCAGVVAYGRTEEIPADVFDGVLRTNVLGSVNVARHILPTAWQAVKFAELPDDGTLAVLGAGPVGQFCARIGRHLGTRRVIVVDSVAERLEMARRHGAETLDSNDVDDVAEALIELTSGRGPDGVIDAVGMEAHDSPAGKAAHAVVAALPDSVANPLADKMAVDRMGALRTAIKSVRRGGTVSVSGVYGGEVDPMPMMEMFDRGITMRMGQCHVKRWIGDILPAVMDDSDPLGTFDMTTHHLPLDQAPHGYEIFQKKQDSCIKVVLHP
jgi:threonine dehydrogenase-like Zn-dependent dehydrogenase